MSKEIKTNITIQAKPALVWETLTTFANYNEWNPFIKSIEGAPVVGEKITVKFEKMTFKPMVLAFEKNYKFEWIGHLFFKGIFDGQHSFELIDNGDGSTTFLQSEQFKGILIPFLRKMLDGDTKNNFIAMNEALKKRVEGMAELSI